MTAALVIAGSFMIGFWVPEFAAAIQKQRISFLENIWCACGSALLAAGLVL